MKIRILSLLALVSLYSCTAISEKATEKAAKENAYLSSFLKTFWIGIHVITCLFIMANTIRHW